MPRITITLGSARPGGLDITLAGLCAQTFQDFEVVFVDARYHKRHTQVLDAVKRSGLKQPFYHVPNHRYSDSIWGTACAGYNTGFALSAGELIVMLLDYTYVRPDWLEHHVAQSGKLVMAPHEYRTLTGAFTRDGQVPMHFDRQRVASVGMDAAIELIRDAREEFDEISCFPTPFTADQLDVFPIEGTSIPEKGEEQPYFFSTKNESFPRKNVFDVNGMRELWDRGRGPGDPDLGYRLAWSGLSPTICREAVVHCLNPRSILPNMNLVAPESGSMPPPYDERITVEQGNEIYNAIRAGEQKWADNPIGLMALRAEIWDWRRLSQQREAVLPRNVVGDAEYFGRVAE
ncbi:MAG: glycosyltransferase family 2 protein [Anaerolineae bacterium]|nr:MAG: glycosyltransferase family 2 protein [Anaerolineae bacterium]